MTRERLVHLAEAINAAGLAGPVAVGADDLRPLPLAGVAHDHVAIARTGRIARLPRLSQSGLGPEDNLRYQAACFARAAPSGTTPALHGLLPVGPALPMGGLVVAAVGGRVVRLPDDLPALADCLAAIHRLPPPADPVPLPVHADAVAATLAAIRDQAQWLDAAGLHPDADRILREEIGAPLPGAPGPQPTTLVVADAHPGNFLVDTAGKAWFVDLEKAAYGQPAIDVAHVTLPTSVGWDARVAGGLSDTDVAAFQARYLAALPPGLATRVAPWLKPLRRLTWLRTVTWFVRWRARSSRPGDPWSAADLPPALRAHMTAHVDAMLQPAVLAETRAHLAGR